MWIYPAAPQQLNSPATQNHSPAIESGKSSRVIPQKPSVKSGNSATVYQAIIGEKVILRLSLCFLLGMLSASLLSISIPENFFKFYRYYAFYFEKILQCNDWMMIFSVEFLSTFFQLSLAVLCGFCTFGKPFLYLLLFLKGIGSGVLFSGIYTSHQIQGVLMSILILWIPETLLSILLIFFCCCAIQSAHTLQGICFHQLRPSISAMPQKLFFRYLSFCLLSMLPCALKATLALLFIRVIQ